MKEIFRKKPAEILFWLGVVLLPVLEFYRSFFGHRLQLFGIAVEELLLLTFWLGLFAAGLLFALKEKSYRSLFVALGASALFAVYLFIHSLNAAKFDSSLLPDANPDFFTEAYYLVRMYFAPFSLVFSVYLFRIPKKTVFSALKCAAAVISLGVIVPCLFGFSFASYADGNVQVQGGFFSWFSLTKSSPFALYTAKGLFSDANAVGAVLFGIFPFAAAGALKKASAKNLAFVFLVGFAAVAVGTKIASLGFFLSVGAIALLSLVSLLLNKEGRKNALCRLLAFCLAAALCIPLYLVSPGKHLQDKREAEEESAERETDHLDEIEDVTEELFGGDTLEESDIALLEEYLEEYHWDHFIDPWFLELYPVRYDPLFWVEVISRDNFTNADSRRFKLEMISRITERNSNPYDCLLGIGYTAGTPYAERDFFGQYPLFGIGGLLVLILPYFALLAVGAWLCAVALIRKRDLFSKAVPTLAVASFMVAAYFAGHVFDTLFSTYFLAACGAALVSLRYKNDV